MPKDKPPLIGSDNIGNVFEGPPVEALAYVFAQLEELGAKTEAQRRDRAAQGAFPGRDRV
jgi:hypothetical protein